MTTSNPYVGSGWVYHYIYVNADGTPDTNCESVNAFFAKYEVNQCIQIDSATFVKFQLTAGKST